MLQVVIPGERMGHQFKAGGALYRGTVGFISGMDTNGYYTIKNPSTGTEAAMSIYPVTKYYYPEFYADTSDAVDKIASGDPLIVFKGGEYITDRFITSGTGTIGSSTSSPYYYDYKRFDTAAGTWVAATDTAGYTEGAGKLVYLWPSTAAATKGYLRVATAVDGSAPLSKFNKNFLLIRSYSRGYQYRNNVHFRVVGNDAFSGRFWTGVSTAAMYNVSIVNA